MRRGWVLLLGPWLASCGERAAEPPPLPTGKVPPSLVRQVRGRPTSDWLAQSGAADPAQRAEALLALGELLDEPAALAALLERGLGDVDAGVRHAAVLVAGRVPRALAPAAEQALVAALAAPERGLARAAAAAVEARGALAGPALAEALAAPDERLAREAARALGSLRGAAAPWAGALVTRLREDQRLSVLLEAQRALARVGPEAVPALAQGLPGAPTEAALQLLDLLRVQGPAALPAWPQLRPLLEAPEGAVAAAAAEAVVALGPKVLPLLEAEPAGAVAAVAERIRAAAAAR
ncbi:MAG: hypothetical protein ACKOSS_08915 [Planctomycetia bacterium]